MPLVRTKQVTSDHTAVNYSPSSAILTDHLAGIDAKLAASVTRSAIVNAAELASNITPLSGVGASVGGITVAAADLVYLGAQTTGSENGIYTVAAGAWTRIADWTASDDVSGYAFSVIEGTHADKLFLITSNPSVPGTDTLTESVLANAASLPDTSTIDWTVEADGTLDADVILAASGGIKDATGLAVEPADFAGTGLEDDGSDNLRIAAAAAGDGLNGGGGSALSVDTGDGLQIGGGVGGATAVNIDVSDFAGSGLEDDGSENLRIAAAAAGDGLNGGAGSALSVDAGDGLQIGGGIGGATALNIDVSDFAGNGLVDDASENLAIDGTSTVTFTTGVWTWPVGTTAVGLFVTGTPVDSTHVVNKAYVDSVAAGLDWIDHVHAGGEAGAGYIGTGSITEINALSPVTGDIVVAEDGGTPSAGTSDALTVGDVAEFDGTSWIKLVDGVGGFVPDGFRAIVATSSTFVTGGGLTASTDEGKIAEWDGTGLTPASLTSQSDGNATLVKGTDEFSGAAQPVNHNIQYVFDGSVPTGSWIAVGGPGSSQAGAGLSASGLVLNVGDAGKGVQVNADDLEIDASEIAGDGLEAGASSHLLDIKTPVQESLTTEVITGSDTALADTLASTPLAGTEVLLFLNGVQQEQGAGNDFTISGSTITWLASSGTAVDMDTGDVLVAKYLIA